MIKRVGIIYTRDISKSKDKTHNNTPLRELTLNHPNNQTRPHPTNHYNLQHPNNCQLNYPSPSYHHTHNIHSTEHREISFNNSQHQSIEKVGREDKESESQVVRKLRCVNSIIGEIGSLKGCSLKSSQSAKLAEIEDRLLAYERRVLQTQKNNYS